MKASDLITKAKEQGRNTEDIALIRRAYEFAERAHKGQKRKSGEPFINHPLTTAGRLLDFHLDTETIAAALLHDVPEDTAHTLEEIRKEFGDEIAELVEGVTKLDKIKYKGLERSAESLRKMFLAIGEDIRIVLLKLTDRLHNIETLKHLSLEKQRRIALETLEIYAPLAYRLGIKELSGKLEDLSFPYVHPKEYEWVVKISRDKYRDLDAYIETIIPFVKNELAKEEIHPLDIHARKKYIYSLYKKLQKYDLDINKITDIVAMRIILPTVEDCYATLGIVHKLWPPMPGKIKDFIALPKPNGYQSLHTTVFGPDERSIEIQMRTREMHEEAEHGIAAHWAYAEFKRTQTDAYRDRSASFKNEHRFAWLNQIREWQKEFEKPSEFLESLKIDFFKHRIFVLTPKGDVIDLPEGATPVDFAYHIHTDVGNTTAGARVNGKMVALDQKLKTGDIVEILTQKGKKPSADWVGLVKSADVRKKLGGILRKIETDKRFSAQGSELYEFHVTARDRVGLLRDITQILAKQKINVEHVSTDTKHKTLAVMVFRATFKTRQDLERMLLKLKEIKNVEEVNYRPIEKN